MTVTHERPAAPSAPVRSSRWAWLALLASLALYPLAIAVAIGNPGWGDVFFVALTLLPPVAGILLGARSGRTGNGLGALATAIGSAWLTLIVVFYLGANYLWTGESGFAPAALAITTALVVGGAVEAGWYRLRKTGRHPA